MKIKLLCSEAKKQQFQDAIQRQEITFSNQGELVVIEPHVNTEYLLVKDKEEYMQIAVDDIYYIESFGADIQIHTQTGIYQARENLHTLEGQLYEKGCIRVHKSYIVNKRAIQRIRPSIHMKFQLVLVNQDVIEVTRSYYYAFKEEMGF